jgi:hypothetical protein
MSIKINNSVNLYSNIVKCKEQGLTGSFKEIRKDDGKSDKKRIGFATVKGETKGKLYIMTAHYGEKFTVDNPIITVKLKGKEYDIDISKVDPENATDLEMFALCSYEDATKGRSGSFGRWTALKYQKENAIDNGEFKETNSMEEFKELRQNWLLMVAKMRELYLKSGIYKQVLKSNILLESMKKPTVSLGRYHS